MSIANLFTRCIESVHVSRLPFNRDAYHVAVHDFHKAFGAIRVWNQDGTCDYEFSDGSIARVNFQNCVAWTLQMDQTVEETNAY